MRKVYTSAGPVQVSPDAWDTFTTRYKQISSAGGIIVNEVNGDLLFIFRNKRWDLPKGKQEPGEDIAQTALREVQEECGVPQPSLGRLICETYHTYAVGSDVFLKKTSWFRMTLSAEQMEQLNLKPQCEEGIEKVCWIPQNEAISLIQNSYGNISDVLTAFFDPAQ